MARRIRLLASLLFFSFFIILIKLFYWQVISHQQLTLLANSQYSGKREIPAERGLFYSRDNFPLVLNHKSYLLYVNPQKLKLTPLELAGQLRTYTQISKESLLSLTQKDLFWVPLARDLSEEIRDKINGLVIEGLGFEPEDKRFYPEASMAAHLLGFVGFDSTGQKKGYFGLEGFYDYELKGKPGIKYYEQDALGSTIHLGGIEEVPPVSGRSLYLNLDRSLQFLSERYLLEGLKKTGAESGWVVILNPKNGAVLALATNPDFDPAKYYVFEADRYRNPVISTVFEPGSIFKVITMASALDSGSVGLNEVCTKCAGPRVINNYTIKTWNEKYYPDSTLTDIIVHSDNVGMVYVAEKMGALVFENYLRKFGFGEETGIDLQGEISPLLKDGNWREIDLATASFGQGIAATPIQIVSAVSAIANNGYLYQPEVVVRIAEEKREMAIEPVLKRKVISEFAAERVKEMMVQMVEQSNVSKLRQSGYKVAGKSGTAQIPSEGKYAADKTMASFIGFAPADDPRFVMLVTLKEPKSSIWAEATAAPVWFNIANAIFRLWQIKPEG